MDYIKPLAILSTCVITPITLLLLSTTTNISIKRHINWYIDTIYALPCIALPKIMDGLQTKRFVRKLEDETLAKAGREYKRKEGNKRTIGIVFVMGAQNQGCHLVYETFMTNLTNIMNKKGINIVWEMNRWANDEPIQSFGDHMMSPKCTPPQLRFHFLRRVVGDYMGLPTLFLFHPYSVNSVDASVQRLNKRFDAAGINEREVCLLAHSLGGAVVYRYLQEFPDVGIDKVFTIGSMNHFTNPDNGLNPKSRAQSQSPSSNAYNPFFPVRVPHLDILDGSDFLSFPFYQSDLIPDTDEYTDSDLVLPDENHKTVWVKEWWLPIVFAHSAYWHAESVYDEVCGFLERRMLTTTTVQGEKKREKVVLSQVGDW